MSSQRGNDKRSRAQKYQNKTVYKNDLHDKSYRIKTINNIKVNDVCLRCKDIIEWKIKYKKYKPLSQLKKCVKCNEKAVKQAYRVICTDCVRKFKACSKCCQPIEVLPGVANKQEEMKAEVQKLLQALPERKRRTLIRHMDKMENGEESNFEEYSNVLTSMINRLKMEEHADFSDTDEESFNV